MRRDAVTTVALCAFTCPDTHPTSTRRLLFPGLVDARRDNCSRPLHAAVHLLCLGRAEYDSKEEQGPTMSEPELDHRVMAVRTMRGADRHGG